MCFNTEYEWYALIHEESIATADRKTFCNECQRPIKVGSWLKTIHQQEWEDCQTCGNGDCSCTVDCCECDEPDFGETFDYECCEECHKFLQAVKAAEIDAGCQESEALLPYTAMIDDIGISNSNDKDAANKYFDKARWMFPELAASGYLLWLWRAMGYGE